MILKGITQKGKNRIREHGNEWVLVRQAESVLFSQEPGPWWFVYPVTGGVTECRWIRNTRDKDFEVVV